MTLVNLEDILVPSARVRKEFDEKLMDELYQSILDVGLLQPPVVDKEGFLLAGERRYRVMKRIADEGKTYWCCGKQIKPGLAMVTQVQDMSPLTRLQAEYDENVVRTDFTWQEKAIATEGLAKLRAMQVSIREAREVEADSKAVVREVARELAGETQEAWQEHTSGERAARTRDVEKDLFIAAWLTHEDEEVSNAKTREEALKLIERKLDMAGRRARAREFTKGGIKTAHEPILGDCLELLPHLPDGFYDVLICDPPYGIDADKFGNQSAVKHEYADALKDIARIWLALAEQGFRICKKEAHAYIFCDLGRFETLRGAFSRAGWSVWNSPLIWAKGANGIAPRPEHGPRRTYEAILYAIKGDKRVNYCRSDVFTVQHERAGRAAAKPVELYRQLLDQSCRPGDRVIDPTCGTGPIFSAASRLSLVATGIEIDPAAFGIAVKRIQGVEPPEGGDELGSDGSGESSGGGEEGDASSSGGGPASGDWEEVA